MTLMYNVTILSHTKRIRLYVNVTILNIKHVWLWSWRTMSNVCVSQLVQYVQWITQELVFNTFCRPTKEAMDDIFTQCREGNSVAVRLWLDNTENDLNLGWVHTPRSRAGLSLPTSPALVIPVSTPPTFLLFPLLCHPPKLYIYIYKSAVWLGS